MKARKIATILHDGHSKLIRSLENSLSRALSANHETRAPEVTTDLGHDRLPPDALNQRVLPAWRCASLSSRPKPLTDRSSKTSPNLCAERSQAPDRAFRRDQDLLYHAPPCVRARRRPLADAPLILRQELCLLVVPGNTIMSAPGNAMSWSPAYPVHSGPEMYHCCSQLLLEGNTCHSTCAKQKKRRNVFLPSYLPMKRMCLAPARGQWWLQ